MASRTSIRLHKNMQNWREGFRRDSELLWGANLAMCPMQSDMSVKIRFAQSPEITLRPTDYCIWRFLGLDKPYKETLEVMMSEVNFRQLEMIWHAIYVTRNADQWLALWATVVHATNECSVAREASGLTDGLDMSVTVIFALWIDSHYMCVCVCVEE